MRKPARDIQVFSLAALDVLAMATGAFVVLVVLLMPYYRKTQHAQAEIADIKVAVEQELARAAQVQKGNTRRAEAIADMQEKVDAAMARADTLGRRLASVDRALVSKKQAAKTGGDEAPTEGTTAVSRQLDVVFVMDTTRSMLPAIRELTRSLSGIVRVLQRLVPSVRIGFVSYTDRDTGFNPIRAMPITDTTTGKNRILSFVQRLRPPPRGSTTIEEDVHLGVSRAIAMNWRAGAKQVIIVIGDAQAKRRFESRLINQVRTFIANGKDRAVSSLFISTPHSRSRGEYDRHFFRRLAQAGAGNYATHTGQMFESIILSVLTPART